MHFKIKKRKKETPLIAHNYLSRKAIKLFIYIYILKKNKYKIRRKTKNYSN